EKEPHRPRRQVPEPRRARDRRTRAGAEARAAARRQRYAARIPARERRASQAERRSRRVDVEEDVTQPPVGRAVRTARQLESRSVVRRSPNLLLQGQGSGPTGSSWF